MEVEAVLGVELGSAGAARALPFPSLAACAHPSGSFSLCSFRGVSEERETSAAAEPQPSSMPWEVTHPSVSLQPEAKLVGSILVVGLLLAGQPSTKHNVASCRARRQEHLTCPALVLFPAESVGFGPCNISLGAELSGLGGLRQVDGADSAQAPTLTSHVGWICRFRAGDSSSARTGRRFAKDWHGGGEVKQ